ncbi:MAG: orotidine 5'-phosphate decarboxylase [Rhodobacter sp.]|nr:orotidine 5'-phosphate decarboxylase [Rhodobacter sp.]
MLLQIAFDKPEHLGVLPLIRDVADIVEVGTPLLKRFGVSAITTAREICPDVPVLADTKSVDGGTYEAEMVFGAGASFMTVLSCAPTATLAAVDACARRYEAAVVLDTITETDEETLIYDGTHLPDSFNYIALHASTDTRLAGDASSRHINAVASLRTRGFRVSLAGGIGPKNLDAAVAAGPDILVVGSAITEAPNPLEMASWIKKKLPQLT